MKGGTVRPARGPGMSSHRNSKANRKVQRRLRSVYSRGGRAMIVGGGLLLIVGLAFMLGLVPAATGGEYAVALAFGLLLVLAGVMLRAMASRQHRPEEPSRRDAPRVAAMGHDPARPAPRRPPSTTEVLARRALNRSIDQRWVQWAVAMLETGHDSPHLRMLAGALPPFHKFEMTRLADKALAELGLGWSNTEALVMDYAAELLEDMLQGARSSDEVLDILFDMCMELDTPDFLSDFSLLYQARAELRSAKVQWYWPRADRSNIEQAIREYATRWLDEYKSGDRAERSG